MPSDPPLTLFMVHELGPQDHEFWQQMEECAMRSVHTYKLPMSEMLLPMRCSLSRTPIRLKIHILSLAIGEGPY